MTKRHTYLAGALLLLFGLGWFVAQARADMTSKFRYAATGVTAAANTDILPSDVGPSDPRRPSTALRVTIALVSTDSVLNVQVTNSSTGAQTFALNNGTALTAGRLYTFEFGNEDKDPDGNTLRFNLQCATATTAGFVSVQEVQ